MRSSMKSWAYGLLLTCLMTTPHLMAQYVVPSTNVNNIPAYSPASAGKSTYVPNQPQAIYTNVASPSIGQPVMVDPLAHAEASRFGQYPGMYPSGPYANSCYDNCGGGCEVPMESCYAADSCNTTSCVPVTSRNHGLTCGKWFLTGWLDQGFSVGSYKPQSGVNYPLKYNDLDREYQLNQIYLSMGRAAATSGTKWDVGVRADLLYGSDYLWTSAIGLETRTKDYMGNYQNDPTALPSRWNSNSANRGDYYDYASKYGLAMPQAYVELYAPVGCGLTVKAGHFYSIFGYESAMSPENFFYSHSYSMMYGEPTTQSGILFAQRLSQTWTAYFGLTRGWDNWEDPNGKLSYLAGIRWTSLDKRTDFSFVAGTGNESMRELNVPAYSDEDNIRTHYSMVLSHQLAPRLKLVTQHDMGYERNANFGVDNGNVNFVGGHWYSISQYAFLQLTDTLTFGVRGEWFRDVNGARVLRLPVSVDNNGVLAQLDGTDYTQITAGLNWTPKSWLTVRPEARWDWSDVSYESNVAIPPSGDGMYSDFQKRKQFTASISTILTY